MAIEAKKVDPFTWWRTPVWLFDTGLPTEFNDAIIRELISIGDEIAASDNPKNSLFDYSRPAIDFLKALIVLTATRELHKDIPEAKALNISLSPTMAWVNVKGKDESIEAHAHNDASLMATYYLKAPENCGDLAYLDTSSIIGEDGAFNKVAPQIEQVTPKAGLLVIMPAYVFHEVQKNKSDELRVSLSTDLTQIIDKQAPNAMIIKSWVNSIRRLECL